MRIIAGTLGGRIFAAPAGQRTHPMSDKMRGALFNMLGDITGKSVLDAFAGSGALSFEAASRGAQAIIAIEKDRRAQQTITENLDSLQLTSVVRLIKASAGAWLQTSADTFDIVLLDPPYDDVQTGLLQSLSHRLKPAGTLVLSWPGKQPPPSFDELTLQASKQYGDASLHLFTS